MSQRDFSNLGPPLAEESPLITALLGVSAVFLVIGIIVLSYYLKTNYDAYLWSWG